MSNPVRWAVHDGGDAGLGQVQYLSAVALAFNPCQHRTHCGFFNRNVQGLPDGFCAACVGNLQGDFLRSFAAVRMGWIFFLGRCTVTEVPMELVSFPRITELHRSSGSLGVERFGGRPASEIKAGIEERLGFVIGFLQGGDGIQVIAVEVAGPGNGDHHPIHLAGFHGKRAGGNDEASVGRGSSAGHF